VKASSSSVVRLSRRTEQQKLIATGKDRRSKFDLQMKSSVIAQKGATFQVRQMTTEGVEVALRNIARGMWVDLFNLCHNS